MFTPRQVVASLAGVLLGVLAFAGYAQVLKTPELPAMEASVTPVEEEGPKPFWVVEQADVLASALESAPFVSAGRDGPPLYVVTFRGCPTCLVFKESELDTLKQIPVDVRWIVYSRAERDGRSRSTPEERALVAELALTRDYALFEAWYAASPEAYYASAQLPPMADGDPERMKLIEDLQTLVGDTLAQAAQANEMDLAIPALFWKEPGGWRGYIGYDPESFAAVKQALAVLATPRALEPSVGE